MGKWNGRDSVVDGCRSHVVTVIMCIMPPRVGACILRTVSNICCVECNTIRIIRILQK